MLPFMHFTLKWHIEYRQAIWGVLQDASCLMQQAAPISIPKLCIFNIPGLLKSRECQYEKSV